MEQESGSAMDQENLPHLVGHTVLHHDVGKRPVRTKGFKSPCPPPASQIVTQEAIDSADASPSRVEDRPDGRAPGYRGKRACHGGGVIPDCSSDGLLDDGLEYRLQVAIAA
jgi:hypothetical protein